MNNEYLNDPWISLHPRKHMANPKRWPWKNAHYIENQYKFTFWTNAAIGATLTAPFAVWLARRMKRYQGGVPAVPYLKYGYDFVNLDPGYYSRKAFRFYFFGLCLAGGYMFASYTVDANVMKDPWFTRPDLKPFPAMVPKDELDITERTMLEAHYQTFRNKEYKENKKHRTWYRLFFPADADYSVSRNPYTQTHRENVYNPANNYYARPGNTFRQHVNE